MTRFTDDLLLLEELRRAGSLTDDEFAVAKARVLTGNADVGAVEAQAQLVKETNMKLRRLELQNRLTQVEENWNDVKQTLVFRDEKGKTTVPTVSNAKGIAVVGGIATIVFAIASVMNDIPLIISFLFLVVGAITVMHCYNKATEYNAAEAHYLSEKSDIESRILALKTGRDASR